MDNVSTSETPNQKSIYKTKICPKCNHIEEIEFTICPACQLIIRKYYNPSVRSKNKSKALSESIIDSLDSESSGSKTPFKSLSTSCFIATLILTLLIFAGTKGTSSLPLYALAFSLLFAFLFLIFYVIHFFYRVISGKDTFQEQEDGNSIQPPLLLFAALLGFFIYFSDFNVSALWANIISPFDSKPEISIFQAVNNPSLINEYKVNMCGWSKREYLRNPGILTEAGKISACKIK